MAEKWNRTPNTVCEICGTPCYIRPSRLKVQKHITCSRTCNAIARKRWIIGEGNHQFGLKGEINSSYKGHREKIKSGYRFIRVPEHPFAEKQGWVREHRLVAERYLLTEENSIEINGELYLKPELEVHHIDENKLNNDKDNLMVLTKSEHRSLHNNTNKYYMETDEKTGRFIKSSKKDLNIL